MFDLGWSELLVIGITALIILGPRDLTKMFRELGRFTGKLRRMARDFQRAMEDAADEAGVKDAAKDLRSMTNPSKMGMDKLKEATDSIKDYDPTKPSEKAASVGPETAKLSEERAEAARKIREYSAEKTQARLDREKAEAEAAAAEPAETVEPPKAGDKA